MSHPKFQRFDPAWTPGEWAVVRDLRGRLNVVDEHGVPVLEQPDPVRQLEYAYWIQGARGLRLGIAPVIRRMWRITVDHGFDLLDRDDRAIGRLWHALLLAAPPSEALDQIRASRDQQELVWKDSAA